MGVPEARPLTAEIGPSEATPIQPAGAPTGAIPAVPVVTPSQAAGRATPMRIQGQPIPAANAPRQGHPAVPNPAPAFVTDFVRRAGLSNGSVESESAIAWRIVFAAGAVAGVLVIGLLGALVGRARK